MSAISGVSNFGSSPLHALQQLSSRTADLVNRVSNPAGDITDFAAAIVEMNEVQLQTKAAMAVLHTTHNLAEQMLSLPRK